MPNRAVLMRNKTRYNRAKINRRMTTRNTCKSCKTNHQQNINDVVGNLDTYLTNRMGGPLYGERVSPEKAAELEQIFRPNMLTEEQETQEWMKEVVQIVKEKRAVRAASKGSAA